MYDNRSLVLMLEQLKDQLNDLKELDGKKTADAIGTQQVAASASTTLSAGVSVTADPKAAGADKPAASSGGGDSKASDAGPQLKWSERAADLLADQVNLSYDIFNLQLLLERAISDRVMPSPEGEVPEPKPGQATERAKGRVQAVIGIPISLDPPAYAAGCVAIVEVRLKADYPLSLVVLFPQEDTYNAAISGHRSVSFSASASQGGAGASGSFGSTRDTSAIRRETDTVAFQREDGRVDELIFGWEFFPGAGRPSVAPGMRQLLAVVSLQQADQGIAPARLEIQTRTAWRKFNSSTLTVTDRCGWRALFTNRPVESPWCRPEPIQVMKTESIEGSLLPVVKDIDCYRVGETAVIVVNGDNFFTGTSVVMGDQVYAGRETNLVLKSARVMQIQAPLKALTNAAVLNGRYGPSQPLSIDPAKKFNLRPPRILGSYVIPTESERTYIVRMLLGYLDGDPGPNFLESLKKLPRPVLAIDGQCISSDVSYSQNENPAKPGFVQTWANVIVDAAAVKSRISMVLRLTFPLCGPDWSLELQTYDPREGVRVVRHVDGATTKLLLSGAVFAWDRGIAVWMGTEYGFRTGLRLVRDDLMELEVPTDMARTFSWLFLFTSFGSTRIPIEDPPTPGGSSQLAPHAAQPPTAVPQPDAPGS